METTKKWWRSKTVWSGVIGAAVVAYNSLSDSFGLPPVPEFVYAILSFYGLYGRSVAKTKLSK